MSRESHLRFELREGRAKWESRVAELEAEVTP